MNAEATKPSIDLNSDSPKKWFVGTFSFMNDIVCRVVSGTSLDVQVIILLQYLANKAAVTL